MQACAVYKIVLRLVYRQQREGIMMPEGILVRDIFSATMVSYLRLAEKRFSGRGSKPFSTFLMTVMPT